MLWRIATYQVLLAVTGIVFMVYLRKTARRPSKAVEEKVLLEPVPIVSSDTRALTNSQALPSESEGAERLLEVYRTARDRSLFLQT